MTDDQLDEPDFDDRAHDPIRELLSAARVDTPIPADVAARLDAALAELTGEEPTSGAVVVPLRRRLAPRLLAAAAVVLVAGAGAVGLNHVLNNNGPGHSVAASSDTSGGAVVPGLAPTPAPSGDALQSLANGTLRLAYGNVPVLTSADFAQQAANLPLGDFGQLDTVDGDFASNDSAAVPRSTPSATGTLRSPAAPRQSAETKELAARPAAIKARQCVGPKLAGTTSYPIILDGKPAVLVVHPASGGSRLFEAWSCNGSVVLAFTTVPN